MEQAISGDNSFELSGRIMHVRSIRTTAPEIVVADFARMLSRRERDQAAKFRFERLRVRYVLTAGALRIMLGRYLHVAPQDVEFRYGGKGKPSLQEQEGECRFNLSHSGDLALFGFAAGCELGVDVERMRAVDDMFGIAGGFFCPEETTELRRLPAHLRQKALLFSVDQKGSLHQGDR